MNFMIYIIILIPFNWKCNCRATKIMEEQNNKNIVVYNKITNNTTATTKTRVKRVLPFPNASTVGMIVAVAVPIEIPNREIFFSYNFEANYNSPATYDFTSTRISQILGESQRSSDDSAHIELDPIGNSTKNGSKVEKINKKKKIQQSQKTKREALTRNIIYRSLRNNLMTNGFHGKYCLLKAICEAAEIPFGEHNGVLGDIIHIILTPSSSKYDNIPDDYYEAEYNGSMGFCDKYNEKCPISALNFLTLNE